MGWGVWKIIPVNTSEDESENGKKKTQHASISKINSEGIWNSMKMDTLQTGSKNWMERSDFGCFLLIGKVHSLLKTLTVLVAA